MKKKTISILLTLTLVFGLFGALPALAEESDAAAISLYSGSDDMDFWDAVFSEGSKEVTITTADQLMAFMQLAKSMSFKDWTIKLGADIVINTGDASTWGTEDPAYKWGAANKYDYVFASTFDGQGHVISGLYSEGKGFFGYANGNATVKNLSIVNSYFKNTAGGNGCRMGGVVGEFSGESLTIQNVYVSATLEGVDAEKTADCIGGLLGYAQCTNLETGTITIENSVFDGKIIGVKVTGGLIGRLHIVKECTIKNSYANVDMNVGVEDAETASISGGLIGQINRCNLTVSDCVVTGTITSKNSKQVSALFGFVTGKINKDDTDYSYTISCSDVLLAVGSASYDSVLGTLDLGTTEAPLNNITWTVENVKYDSSLVAENLPISVGTTTLNATGDTTVNLKGTNAGFTDWAIVENDYPLPVADLIPEIDVDTYKNYVAPVVPGVAPTVEYGASIRISDGANGIRFCTTVKADRVANAKDYGILLVKYGELVSANADFTAYSMDSKNVTYAKISALDDNGSGISENGDGMLSFNIVLTDLPEDQLTTRFAIRAYAVYNVNGTDVYVYSDFSEDANVRSMANVAYCALRDLKQEKDAANGYIYEIDTGKWSCYTKEQYDIISLTYGDVAEPMVNA
ncbi:MAG: hypothetical protein IJZ80_00010 [Clostridia bacterium]|nr:hypothetical protein [Clostridia bacterium]